MAGQKNVTIPFENLCVQFSALIKLQFIEETIQFCFFGLCEVVIYRSYHYLQWTLISSESTFILNYIFFNCLTTIFLNALKHLCTILHHFLIHLPDQQLQCNAVNVSYEKLIFQQILDCFIVYYNSAI